MKTSRAQYWPLAHCARRQNEDDPDLPDNDRFLPDNYRIISLEIPSLTPVISETYDFFYRNPGLKNSVRKPPSRLREKKRALSDCLMPARARVSNLRLRQLEEPGGPSGRDSLAELTVAGGGCAADGLPVRSAEAIRGLQDVAGRTSFGPGDDQFAARISRSGEFDIVRRWADTARHVGDRVKKQFCSIRIEVEDAGPFRWKGGCSVAGFVLTRAGQKHQGVSRVHIGGRVGHC